MVPSEATAVVEANQLIGHAHLVAAQVEPRLAKTDQLAPAHSAVDGEVDECPGSRSMRFREVDGLAPSEEDHLSGGNARWLNAVEGVGNDLLLRYRDLEHPSQGPVVTVDRVRCVAGLDLVVQPVLDLVGREASDLVRAEAGEDVFVDVAAVGLLGRWRESARE